MQIPIGNNNIKLKIVGISKASFILMHVSPRLPSNISKNLMSTSAM